MSEVRKGGKRRRLMIGESQDKDGKYRYKYCDAFGKRKSFQFSPNFAQTKEKICKAIPGYAKKCEQMYCHKNIGKLLKVLKI